MSMKGIYIIGSSGHACVIAELIECSSDYEVIGFIDDIKDRNTDVLGYKILGDINFIIELSKSQPVNIALGIGDSDSREKIVNKICDAGEGRVFFPILIHSTAVVSRRANISEGCIILANAIIGCNAVIGKHCLLNHSSCVDHDSKLKDFVSLCPNVFIAGNVSVGNNTIIGLGANIIEKIKIGNNTYIGAGSCVVTDHIDDSVIFGVPGKFIKKKSQLSKFFK